MAFAKISLDDKYTLDKARAYMTGIEALVRLPMLQHQRDLERGLHTAGFVSGYRGSPLGGVDQAMWKAKKYLDEHNIHFLPGINEDLAATAVRGSQEVNLFKGAKYDGVFSMWYGKGPGVDRSMDVIKHANAYGTSKYGGVLAVAGDDHACKSSTLPHQSEHMFIGASIPVLAPANVQEVLDLGIYGWELSRYSGCWVALKAITENMDSAISAEIDPNRINIVTPDSFDLPADGVHVRWPDSPLEQERRLNRYKIYAAREFARVNRLNRVVIDSPNPRLGIITSGKAYLDVLQALEDLGIDDREAAAIGIRVYKVGMVWPLEPVTTHEFAQGLEEILVVEEKRSVIEDQLTGQLYNWPVERRPRVVGEFDEEGRDLVPNLAEITPAMVARAIASRIEKFYDSDNMRKRLAFLNQKEYALAQPRKKIERKPHFCSGCPHNTSTQLPEGSHALAGIGCHYMALWMQDRPTKTFTQMGGEGVTWAGQAPFTEQKHVFQNLGDGTYFHSGILAIRQSIAAGVNITYKLLYNDAVAMTGGQPVDGTLSIAQVILQLRGEGVKRIALLSDDPYKYRKLALDNGFSLDHRDRLMAIQKELRDTAGTTVIIYEQTCAAEKRRRRKRGLAPDPDRRIFINEAVCEGCGDCGVRSNCLSVLPQETELGRKRVIDQSACNKDYSCVNGFCPSFVSVLGGSVKKGKAVIDTDSFPSLPSPQLPALEKPWNMVITGVGGTGVLTISSLVSMAAHIEGKGCATMNQTGLAQKFGAVVSHVRVAAKQENIKAVRIPAGDADLLLGCDLVVAASDESLAKVNTERSYAVINEAVSPTADFLHDPDAEFPKDAMMAAINEEVGSQKVSFVDATAAATGLMGDSLASNLFLLGIAYQRGLVPVSAEALEYAIELNGVAVEFNKQAFWWGRQAARNLEQVQRAAGLEKEPWKPLQNLDEIIDFRYRHLLDYQDRVYADKYLECVERVKAAEQNILGRKMAGLKGSAHLPLTVAVAKALYKLMAYKDEYEVARLYSNGDFVRKLKQQFEGDFKLQFHMAPPVLSKKDPDTGLPVKRTFSGWMLPLFAILAKFKHLRGTALDVFGYTRERREERALIGEFLRSLNHILDNLRPDNHSLAVEMVEAVQSVRGFGHVKARNLQNYRVAVERMKSKFNGSVVQVIEVEKVA